MEPVSRNEHLSQIQTHWNVLKQAHGGSEDKRDQARGWFVECYEPFVRRYLSKAVGPEAAQELTQEFARRFLEGRFGNADPGRGRFRDYLKTCLFAQVADFRRERARTTLAPLPEGGWEPADEETPVTAEDDQWKSSWRGELIDRALRSLEREEQRDGHGLYTVLKCRMDYPDLHSPEAAQRLSAQLGKGVSAGWFRKRLMAGRERFAALLLEAVAESLNRPTPDEVKDELAELGLLHYCEPLLDRRRR